MNLGDMVQIVRQKMDGRGREDDDPLLWQRPSRGTVVYIGKRFITVAFCDGGGRFLYRESFWPEQIERIKP